MSYCQYSFRDLCIAAYPRTYEKYYQNLYKNMGNQDQLNKEVKKLVKKAKWYSETVVVDGVEYEAFGPEKIE